MSEQLTVNFVAFPHVWPSRTNSKTAAYLLKVGWPKHNKIRNKWLNRTYFVPCSPEATPGGIAAVSAARTGCSACYRSLTAFVRWQSVVLACDVRL